MYGIRVPEGMRLGTLDGSCSNDEVRFSGNPVLTFVLEDCPVPTPAVQSSGLFVELDDDSFPSPGTLENRIRSGSAYNDATRSPTDDSRSRSRSQRGPRPRRYARDIPDTGDVVRKYVPDRTDVSGPASVVEVACKWFTRFLHDALLESPGGPTSAVLLGCEKLCGIGPNPLCNLLVAPSFRTLEPFPEMASFPSKVRAPLPYTLQPPPGSPWLCKLLSEPESHSLEERDRIEDARDFEEGEGRVWPFLPAGDQFALQRLAERAEMDEDTLESEEASGFTFCLLTPGYIMEPVTVTLTAPVEVLEALDSVQTERDPATAYTGIWCSPGAACLDQPGSLHLLLPAGH